MTWSPDNLIAKYINFFEDHFFMQKFSRIAKFCLLPQGFQMATLERQIMLLINKISAAVYVGEMVNSNLRGSFGSFLAFSECLGLQYVLAIGELTQDWRITTVTCMAPPVLGII